MYYYISPSPNDLVHHGVLGMKWGVRRYQNKDGSLTAAGRKHYGSSGDSGKGSSKGSIRDRMLQRSINKIDEDIKSFDPIRNGLKDKSGRQILTKEDVDESIRGLKAQKDKLLAKQKSRNEARDKKIQKSISKIDEDIKSFDPIRNGLKDKSGRQILTKEDVDESIRGLMKTKVDLLKETSAYRNGEKKTLEYVKKLSKQI